MNKQTQTIFIPVSVDERLPDKTLGYHTLYRLGIGLDFFSVKDQSFDGNDNIKNPATHWLEEQSRIVLTQDEWHKIQYCFDALERITKWSDEDEEHFDDPGHCAQIALKKLKSNT